MALATLYNGSNKQVVTVGSTQAANLQHQGWTLNNPNPAPAAPVSTNPQDQIKSANQGIDTATNSLKQFDDPTSYFSLLTKVGDASYVQNQDLISYRQAMRSKLYGDTGYKPENFNLLSADQQDSIRNAGRADLLAGIQAANETQTARGNTMNDLLTTEKGTWNDARQSLLDTISTFQQKKSDAQNSIQTTEKNGYITGYDKTTGKLLYKIDTGVRDQVSGGGAGSVLTAKTLPKAIADGVKYLYAGGYNSTDPNTGKTTADGAREKLINDLYQRVDYDPTLMTQIETAIYGKPLDPNDSNPNYVGPKVPASSKALVPSGYETKVKFTTAAVKENQSVVDNSNKPPAFNSLSAFRQTEIKQYRADYKNGKINFQDIPTIYQFYVTP